MRALLTLMRPRGAGFVLLLPLVGYGYAHWEHALPARAPASIALVVLSWLFLHAGTMWLNAALDRDEGEVLYGSRAAVTSATSRAAHVALVASVAIAALVGLLPALCAASCVVLSLLYSHPAAALKGHPVFGPAINVVGYGMLSPAAGWLTVNVPPTPRTFGVLALFCAFIVALYLNAQCFQADEDRARGYRTLVVTHGPAAVQRAMRWAWVIGAGGVATMAAAGWIPRVCMLAIVIVPPLVWRTATSPTARDALRTARVALLYGVVLLSLAWLDHASGVTPTLTAQDLGAGKISTNTTPMLSLPP